MHNPYISGLVRGAVLMLQLVLVALSLVKANWVCAGLWSLVVVSFVPVVISEFERSKG